MDYTRSEIIDKLNLGSDQMQDMFNQARILRNKTIGDSIYLRGLIEYSNICSKDCLYCGIRKSQSVSRYTLSPQQVLDAAEFAFRHDYGSIVLQGGEAASDRNTETIVKLIEDVKRISEGKLGITLSLGEQTPQTYKKWFDAGAHRYLLRIETSNPRLYSRLHPDDNNHRFETRLKALYDLKETGYQVGTGVMIGLPWQTTDDLADDLLFMKEFDIDMCGMGPYVVSDDTPLARQSDILYPEKWRLDMTFKMIAVLRLLMPDINIAASTALQAIDPMGRIKAVECGANVIMPNISPQDIKGYYSLYNNKPLFFDSSVIETKVKWGEWGDSQHFKNK